MFLSHAVLDNHLTIAHVLLSLCVGGGERMALLLAGQQVRHGHRVLLVSLEGLEGGTLGPEFEAAGVTVARVPKRPRGFDATLFPRLAALFRRERVDVVHTHNNLPLIYASLPGRLCGAGVIHTEHGRHPDAAHRLWMRRAAAAAAHRYVAVSDATADYAREIRAAAGGKLRVILNGTDVPQFARDEAARAAWRARWGAGDGETVVGTVGRMAAVKDHALLLRAMAPLARDGARLVIAGDGPEREATTRLAAELGIAERVSFLGEIRDVASMLSALDVFVLSSRSEGLPMVLAEAMAASLPVVATAVGGVPRVVMAGESGFLVPASDEAALRDKIAVLAQDPAMRRRFGERGLALARERYSLERMHDEYMSAYREVL